MARESWITRNYPIGTRITTPSRNDPEATIQATVINHYTGIIRGVIAGIVVEDDDGNIYRIEAGLLDEEGGGV